MKPKHATTTRLSRCKCCQSKYSKHNSNGSKHGNSAASQQEKRDIRKEMNDEFSR